MSTLVSQSFDSNLLNVLTSPLLCTGRYKRREAPLDPLLLAAALTSGPQVTRHHHHHVFLVDTQQEDSHPVEQPKNKYFSKQAPRSQRLKDDSDGNKENNRSLLQPCSNVPRKVRVEPPSPSIVGAGPPPPSPFVFTKPTTTQSIPLIRNLQPASLQAQCMARTRIPTPHGPAFLHLYRNNHDDKEHLAIVIDHAQLKADFATTNPRFIRSASLDSKWSEDETDLDRLTRGAYIGQLSREVHAVSSAPSVYGSSTPDPLSIPPPLVRIHSECFTGETIGSMRCDCGEQLDEALRLIAAGDGSNASVGRGAVIYLRQEGRGIGLLSKIRAYNLQDMGHDTVQANLLLGHDADERRYDIAAAILKDLGLGSGVELLTNNPNKVESLEVEGIKVVKRRPMVPRSWQQRYDSQVDVGRGKSLGATMIAGGAVYGQELDKYMKTKVERMGHMLLLPPSPNVE